MRDSFLGLEELGRGDTWRSAAAEFIATFLFVFIGAGAVVSLGIFSSEGGGALGGNLVAIAMAHGLAIAILVSATANISGGHINPAVSIAATITRKISPTRGGMYVIAQVVGAILGALLLKAVIPNSLEGGLGSHAIMSDIGAIGGLIVESRTDLRPGLRNLRHRSRPQGAQAPGALCNRGSRAGDTPCGSPPYGSLREPGAHHWAGAGRRAVGGPLGLLGRSLAGRRNCGSSIPARLHARRGGLLTSAFGRPLRDACGIKEAPSP